MYTFNRGPVAETYREGKFHRILRLVSIQAHAEENEPSGGTGGNENPINYEQLIAQARKEEKEKLYPRLKKAEDENKELTSKLNNALLKIAALQDELEKAKSGDPEEVKKLRSQVESLTGEIEELKKSTVSEEDIRSEVKREYEVKLYAQQQLDANKGDILSTLYETITGKTKEDVDSAVTAAKEKTRTIKKELGLIDDDGDDKSKKKPATTKGERKKPSAPPVSVPSSDVEDEDFDPEYIRNLDPRSEEYKEFRKKMGLR